MRIAFTVLKLVPWAFLAANPLGLFLLLAVVSRGASGDEAHRTSAAEKQLTILYTSNTNGIIRSCRCPGNLFGSLPQRARFIKAYRRKYGPVLLVDAGDLFPQKEDPLKARYTLKCYAAMKYDAIGIGEREFSCGTPYLRQLIGETALPFTSANLVLRDGVSPLASRVIIRGVVGIRVGVASIASSGVFHPMRNGGPADIRVLDPLRELQMCIAALRGKVGLIVVLSHLGLAKDKELASQVGGIDVIVGAHSGEVLQQPVRVGKTVIVQAGKNTEYVGVLKLTIDEKGSVSSRSDRIVALKKEIPDDREVARIALEYRTTRLKALGRRPARSAPAGLKRFAPSVQCKKCHEKQYELWAKTKHAHAFETIAKERRADDSECFPCHTTGARMPGGFKDIEDTADMAGVQCQCCHRVDVTHGDDKNKVIASPPVSRQVCITCHGPFNSPNFNYERYLPKVRH